MDALTLRGSWICAASCALGLVGGAARTRSAAPPAPIAVAVPDVPARDGWRVRCERLLDDARRDAAATYGVTFERPVHDPGSRDPDELRFPSTHGIELGIELAPDRGQAGADMILVVDDDRVRGGWLSQAYGEHGFTLETDERSAGGVFVKLELTSRGGADWDGIRTGIAQMLEQAANGCTAR